MQSDVIAVHANNLGPALDMVEKTVRYIGYSGDFGARMRLLSEELISAIRFVLEETFATLWVETTEQNMEIHLRLQGVLSDAARDRLAEIARSRCNQPPKGLFARIGAFFSDAFLSDATGYVPLFTDSAESASSYYVPLSLLTGYDAPAQDDTPAELKNVEASILRGMADDVTVCARPSHAELTVVKKLPDAAAKP
jgi:hypothetical protein